MAQAKTIASPRGASAGWFGVSAIAFHWFIDFVRFLFGY
jgi:hypothetical protein